MGKRVYILDVGADRRIEDQICTLGVKTITGRNISSEACRENVSPLYVFPEEWEQHVAEMPTSHCESTDDC